MAPWPDGQSGPGSGLCDGECWPLPVAHWASFAELATGRQQAWATRRASKPESTIQERGRHQPDDKEWFQAPPINGFRLPPGKDVILTPLFTPPSDDLSGVATTKGVWRPKGVCGWRVWDELENSANFSEVSDT